MISLLCLAAVAVVAGPKRERVWRVDGVTVKNDGAALTIIAEGTVTTGGWTDVQLVRVSSSKNEVVYELTAVPPQGMVMQMLTPVRAEAVYRGVAPARVRVRAKTNSKTVAVPPRSAAG